MKMPEQVEAVTHAVTPYAMMIDDDKFLYTVQVNKKRTQQTTEAT